MDAEDTNPVVETERLVLSRLGDTDAPFLVRLLNEPAFRRNIGDKGVRDEADARHYLANGPGACYAAHGYGLYRVALRGSDTAVGICGLVRRDTLDHPDLGFAFLAAHRGRGYATEAGAAVLAHERPTHGLGRILAITSPGNEPSIRVLEKLGFAHQGALALGEGDEVELFASEAGPAR